MYPTAKCKQNYTCRLIRLALNSNYLTFISIINILKQPIKIQSKIIISYLNLAFFHINSNSLFKFTNICNIMILHILQINFCIYLGGYIWIKIYFMKN